jgi:predicted phage terminase large subunit-like protein
MGIEDGNDYSVCTTWLKRKDDYYLLHVFRGRLNYPDLKQKVRSLAREFGADSILIERSGFGIALMQEFAYNLPGGMVRPTGIVPKGDKKDRLAIPAAKIQAGHVFLPADAPWLADFLAEVLAFPNVTHDDQIDTLSQFLIWASSPRGNPPLTMSLPYYGD